MLARSGSGNLIGPTTTRDKDKRPACFIPRELKLAIATVFQHGPVSGLVPGVPGEALAAMLAIPARRPYTRDMVRRQFCRDRGGDAMTQSLATGEWPSPNDGPAVWPSIPGFEIVAELGRGGMGVVYQARQPELQRSVALKVLRDGALAGPRERARFRLEAEVCARIQHPSIVSIHAVGEHQGQLWFAMELVEGGSLDRHLNGQPPPPRWSAALIRTLALALHQAHLLNIIHRDLKPANILLESVVRSPWSVEGAMNQTDGPWTTDYGLPKVTDFGLAKRLDSESTAWTQDGAVLGTASYMAPEQASGQVHDLGPAVDIYALGAILYELLTGRPPFQGDSWQRTVNQVLNDEPVSPEKLHPGVPRDLETICLKCLEKEPGRRYASAAALAEDLDRFLDGTPILAVPLAAAERLARLAAREGYQLTGEIGRGPHSTVYRARFGELQQPVVLKVFTSGRCSREEWDARLRSNASLLSLLTHPHLVLVQRTGWWEGSGYLVMEHVPQGSLAGRLTGQPFPVRQALHLVEQITEILCYLHRQGVVHGNLKPSNVLLAADGIPRLSDLLLTNGVVRNALPDADLPTTGAGYLAPEQLESSDSEARPHTDIHGVGVILYELLTGRPPFAGATARETLEQVRSSMPVAPSTLNEDVTPGLEAFCLRCLRKNPWERYSRAYDVLRRLQFYRETLDSPIPPGQGWAGRRSRGKDGSSM